jgi:HSP20 family protein
MNALTKWNPFREMDAIQNRFNNLFGRSLFPVATGEETISVAEWSPLVDVAEDDKEYLIKAELPEVKKEDVKVTVDDGALRITGERKFEKEEKGRKYHRIERAYGSFERVFALPEGAKAGDVRAEFHDGLLEVHLPKGEVAKTKSLEVKIA